MATQRRAASADLWFVAADELDEPQPVVLFELVKGFLTDEAPELGDVERIDEA